MRFRPNPMRAVAHGLPVLRHRPHGVRAESHGGRDPGGQIFPGGGRESPLAGQSVNIVFMGMGEPLLNYEAFMQAFRIMADPEGIALSRRKITVSTCGLVDAIQRLGMEAIRPKLAISLNATTDEVRDRLMPVNRRFPLAYTPGGLPFFPPVAGRADHLRIRPAGRSQRHAGRCPAPGQHAGRDAVQDQPHPV